MVRRHIPDHLKEMALSMSLQGRFPLIAHPGCEFRVSVSALMMANNDSDSEIRAYTGISERSLKRIRKTHRAIGEVSNKPAVPSVGGFGGV